MGGKKAVEFGRKEKFAKIPLGADEEEERKVYEKGGTSKQLEVAKEESTKDLY